MATRQERKIASLLSQAKREFAQLEKSLAENRLLHAEGHATNLTETFESLGEAIHVRYRDETDPDWKAYAALDRY